MSAPSKFSTYSSLLSLIVSQVKEIVQLVHESKKTVSHDRSRVEETEGGDVGESEGKTEGDGDG